MRKYLDSKLKKVITLSILLCILLLFLIVLYRKNNDNKELISLEKDTNEININEINKVIDNYSSLVILKDGGAFYKYLDNSYIKDGIIHGNMQLELDDDYVIIDDYYKIKDSDYYVYYEDVIKSDERIELYGEYKYYKNYVVYNFNVILGNKAKLYVDDNTYIEKDGGSYSVIVKMDDKYGIEFNNRLVYVEKSDVIELEDAFNSDVEVSKGVSVLNYHYVVSGSNENGELDECRQSICITDTKFDSHIKYLSDNGYYGLSMRDLELFIDGSIQIPLRSVVITIDDGWYVARSIKILEQYKILGTLFLIGSVASVNDYVSNYLEVHSHTWDMHRLGQCPASVGRGGILCLDDEAILNDLRQSRESLNNTTYFCYPFYDYNTRAIELLKKAGFTMAFVGEFYDSTVRPGQNKFKIPRYVIVNSTSMEEFIRYVS